MQCRLFTLGRALASIGDRPLDPGAELVFAGVLYLALEPGRPIAREKLAALLWPDASHDRQSARLRWLLNRLRTLGLPIASSAASVTLPANAVSVDYLTMAELDLEDVGEVLPGYVPSFSPAFNRWLDEKRDVIATEVARQLLPRLTAAEQADQWQLAQRVAEAIQRVDPLNEVAALAIAEARCRLGAKAQALSGLQEYLDSLGEDRTDLHLPAEVLRRRIVNNGGEIARITDSPFVGRAEQVRRLSALVASARGGAGGAVMITGPAGIGKTRLLDEVISRNATANLQMIRIRCQPGSAGRPLAALADLIAKACELRGALGANPSSYSRLSQFAQAVKDDDDESPQASPEYLRSQLCAALIDVLDASSAEVPVVIVVDDVQWAGRSLDPLWTELATWAEMHRVAFLFGCRTPAPEQPLVKFATISLPLLDGEAAGALLDELLGHVDRVATNDVRRTLLARCGGSPLFLREMTRQWSLTGSIDTLPTSLAGLFEAGIASLTAPARRALEVASILGTQATLERMERLMQLPRGMFIDAIVELENEGILSADAKGNVSGHVFWSEVAMRRVSDAVARVLHRHAAECLDDELASEPSPQLLWETARHWQGASRPDRARAAITRGAEHLVQHGFPEEAASVLSLAADEAEDPLEQLSLLRRRIDLLVAAGRVRDIPAEIDRHEALAMQLNPAYDPHNDLEMIRLRVNHLQRGEIDSVRLAAVECARSVAATTSHRLRAAMEAAGMSSLVAPEMLDELREIVASLEPATREDRWNRDYVVYEHCMARGDVRESVTVTERLVAAARESGPPRLLARALGMRGQAYVLVGRFGDARLTFRESADLSRSKGLSDTAMTAFDAWVGFSLDVDQPVVTRALIKEAQQPVFVFNALGGTASSRLFANHEAQLAVMEGRPHDALAIVTPLDDSLECPVPRWRARFLAMHLAARSMIGEPARAEEIVARLASCFDTPGYWLDWPASVYARHLYEHDGVDAAAEFATHFISEVRRERYAPPAILTDIAARVDGIITFAAAVPKETARVALSS